MRILLAILLSITGASAQTVTQIKPASTRVTATGTAGNRVIGPVLALTPAQTNEVVVSLTIYGEGASAFEDLNRFFRLKPGSTLGRIILKENGTGGEAGSFTVQINSGSGYTIGDLTSMVLEWDRAQAVEAPPTIDPPTITLLTPATSATADTEWNVPFTSSFTASGEHRIASISYQVFNASLTKVADVAADMVASSYAATATLATAGTYTAKAVLYYSDENDEDQSVESSTITITATDPSITTTIDSPADAATLTIDVGTTVDVTATPSSGTITQIELFEDGVSVGTDVSSPWSIAYTPTVLGSHELKVTATRDAGGTSSDTINIVCIPVANNPPTVELTLNASSVLEEGSVSIVLDADAADTDGSISGVEFFRGATSLGTDSGAPYTITDATALTPGRYVYTARATDDDTDSTTSNQLLVDIIEDQTPYMLTGPGDSTAETDQSITISASETNGTGTYLWEKVSGPGDVTFGTPTAISTTVSADASGDYVIRITATVSGVAYVRTGNLTVTDPPYQFTGPANLTLKVNESGTLTATEANGPATYAWAQTSGPGTITFGTPTAISTSVSADVAGSYVVTVTATKDAVPYARTATLTITALPTLPDPEDPPTPDAVNNITLPVLVYDTDDQTDGFAATTVTFKTDSNYVQATGTVLELEVPNLHHGNTLAYSINGQAAVKIRDTTATVMHNLLNNHGTADGYLGDFSYKILRVPVQDGIINAGSNTIRFTFSAPWSPGFSTTGITYDQGHFQTAGYRITYFNFLEPDGDRLLDDSDFVVTDYTAFSAPAGGNAATGAALWTNDTILTSNPNNQSPKRTACFDCHGTGAPLKYFNFENDVIIARARFHGLTTQQGTDIAAYIRGLTPAQTSTNARPWSLPYQPGPNLANLTTQEWAAGEMKAHAIVPDLKIPDVLANAAAHRTEVYGATVDASDYTFANSQDKEWKTRIHFQLPSYMQWVADQHPKEFMGSRTSWNNSNLKREHDQIRARFTTASDNLAATFDWQELDLHSYRYIEQDLRPYFDTTYFRDDEFIYPYSVKKLSAITALDLEITYNLSSVDLYSSHTFDNSREYVGSAIYFNVSPLQSHVSTGVDGHAVGNRKRASKRYLDVGWYAVQLFANPWMGGDNRFLDSGRGYFYGATQDWLSALPGDGEAESMFAFMHQLNVALMRQSQQNQNVNDRSGGAYLPHFNPQVLSDDGLHYGDKGSDADTLPILLAAVENFIDFLDTIPVSTWQTASVVSSMTSGAASTGFRDDTKQLQICYMLLHNLKNKWGVTVSHSTYQRALNKFKAIWPNQSTWP